jgi:asparagine synthase (glutamine-hydrolysing)
MCGIAGYWNYISGRPASLPVLQAMTRSLTHRGPDDEGYWVEGDLAIGMRRLSIVDLAGGHQPMANEDGTVHVVFNGEIYNHEELRGELEARGHRFRTRSDTEAIVHAFEEWGAGCLSRLNGMFGLAVWDGRGQRLLLARDRLGIKPLYVYHGPEGVVFGSELKAVVTAPWVPLEWDTEAVDDFMTYEYVPAPRSIIEGVQKLRLTPRTSVAIGGSSPRLERR